MKKYVVDWDTDGEYIDLPKTAEVPDDIPEDEVADWLSDKYGWCINSLVKTD